jgi:hypothetical protein
LVGSVARQAVGAFLGTLFGLGEPSIGGGLEGLCLGAAAGVGYGLATRRMVDGAPAPRGRARLLTVAATALAAALAAGLVSASGGRLGAMSLASVVDAFPATRRAPRRARPPPRRGRPRRTCTAVGLGEGLLFGAESRRRPHPPPAPPRNRLNLNDC